MSDEDKRITSEQIEELLAQARRERERLAQENLPHWYEACPPSGSF